MLNSLVFPLETVHAIARRSATAWPLFERMTVDSQEVMKRLLPARYCRPAIVIVDFPIPENRSVRKASRRGCERVLFSALHAFADAVVDALFFTDRSLFLTNQPISRFIAPASRFCRHSARSTNSRHRISVVNRAVYTLYFIPWCTDSSSCCFCSPNFPRDFNRSAKLNTANARFDLRTIRLTDLEATRN